MFYKKANESSLVNWTMRYLGAQENVGNVVWFSRLQSGAVKVVKNWNGKRHEHYMSLCRKGTPDIMAVLKDGAVVWLELKTKSGTVRDGQEEFRIRMENVENHYHFVLRELDDLDKFMKGRFGW